MTMPTTVEQLVGYAFVLLGAISVIKWILPRFLDNTDKKFNNLDHKIDQQRMEFKEELRSLRENKQREMDLTNSKLDAILEKLTDNSVISGILSTDVENMKREIKEIKVHIFK